jgi:hypothetical protein
VELIPYNRTKPKLYTDLREAGKVLAGADQQAGIIIASMLFELLAFH